MRETCHLSVMYHDRSPIMTGERERDKKHDSDTKTMTQKA